LRDSLDKAVMAIGAPFPPDFPVKPMRGLQYGIEGYDTKAPVFSMGWRYSCE
jgi:hypothetical protein